MTVGAVVPAAGRGTRFGSSDNKIWTELRGRSLIERTLQALSSHPAIECIVLVGAADELARLRALSPAHPRLTAIVEGGATRAASVRSGLYSLDASVDLVLVHDAARPLVSRSPDRLPLYAEGLCQYGIDSLSVMCHTVIA